MILEAVFAIALCAGAGGKTIRAAPPSPAPVVTPASAPAVEPDPAPAPAPPDPARPLALTFYGSAGPGVIVSFQGPALGVLAARVTVELAISRELFVQAMLPVAFLFARGELPGVGPTSTLGFSIVPEVRALYRVHERARAMFGLGFGLFHTTYSYTAPFVGTSSSGFTGPELVFGFGGDFQITDKLSAFLEPAVIRLDFVPGQTITTQFGTFTTNGSTNASWSFLIGAQYRFDPGGAK